MSCGRVTDAAQGKVSEGTPLLQAVTVVLRVLTPHRELLLPVVSPSKYVLLFELASVTAEAIARIAVEGISRQGSSAELRHLYAVSIPMARTPLPRLTQV
jgi:hypothetical protein